MTIPPCKKRAVPDGSTPPVYDLCDSLASVNVGGFSTVLGVLIVVMLVLPAMGWVHGHLLASVDVTPLSFALLHLGVAFCC